MCLRKCYRRYGGGCIVDCVDRLAINEHIRLPKNVNYIQGSVDNKLVLEQKYDCIFCFEVIEHIDCTDILLENCFDNLKDDGLLFISMPNLASLYSRLELLLGYQPHLLEVSNKRANYGMGVFGRMNNPSDSVLHHIRGITYRAMKELLEANEFKIHKVMGCDKTNLLRVCPRISSTILFVCSKNKRRMEHE